SVLLQGAGQPTAAVLPNWISGYGFVFATDSDLPRARHAREQVRNIPTWTLAYGANDPLVRLLAERIALNGKDVGLLLQPTSAATGDIHLMRIALASSEPWIDLEDLARIAGVGLKSTGGSVEELYAAEQNLLASQRIIPLFHLPVAYAGSASVRNWNVLQDGTLTLPDAWLGNGKP